MTGGRWTPSPTPGHDTFTIWAKHDKVPRGWLPIVTGLSGPDAVNELWTRQDRLRRRDEPCRMVVLPDGKVPQ